MRHKRHSPAEISAKLEQAGELARAGKLQSEIANALGVSVMTFHRWRKLTPARTAPSASPGLGNGARRPHRGPGRLAELQLENSRLRRLVTDLLLEKVSLEEAVGGRAA